MHQDQHKRRTEETGRRLGLDATHRLVDTKIASEIVDLSVPTLEKRRIRGDEPRFLKIGRAVRYDVADLTEWLARCVRNSTSDPGVA